MAQREINIAQMIDHTLLRADMSLSDLNQLVEDAIKYDFFSVCIPPHYVSYAYQKLRAHNPKVCTVVGFPFGYCHTNTKVFETQLAVDQGAEEVDCVINISALKNKEESFLRAELSSVLRATSGKVLKVILETSLLTEDEKILACKICAEVGVHFVKTSTGFSGGGATVQDIKLMKSATEGKCLIKASGGIRDLKTAHEMIAAGASRLGTSSGISIIENQLTQESGSY